MWFSRMKVRREVVFVFGFERGVVVVDVVVGSGVAVWRGVESGLMVVVGGWF